MDLKDVPKMVKNCRTQGPLFQSTLTEDEFRQLRRMMRRLHDLAEAASKVTCTAVERSLPVQDPVMSPTGPLHLASGSLKVTVHHGTKCGFSIRSD